MVPPQPYSGSPGWPPVTTILYFLAGFAACAALRVAVAAVRVIAFRISLRFIGGAPWEFSVMRGLSECAGCGTPGAKDLRLGRPGRMRPGLHCSGCWIM